MQVTDPGTRLQEERKCEIIRWKTALFQGLEDGKCRAEVTIFSKDSDDGIGGEDIGISELGKHSKSKWRWVVANKTGSYEVVLMGTEYEDTSMELEEMGLRNVSL